jgi:DNA-binding NtrC family response regulator
MPSVPTVGAGVKGTVLVIDDEPAIRQLLSERLAIAGFAVTVADSGTAGIEAMRRRRFDVAITDLKMPGLDGVETLSALKEIDPAVPVVMATGYATVETAIEAMKRGAYDYIQKPFKLGDLVLVLERALEQRNLR